MTTMQTLRKVVIPHRSQLDVAPLYVEWGLPAPRDPEADKPQSSKTKRVAVVTAEGDIESHTEDFINAESLKVRPGVRLSFGTYFNAFPASYWSRWTTLKSVRLHAELEGTGALVVYRSNTRGASQHVETFEVDGVTKLDIDLPLNTFGDGGWYWFDLLGGAKALTLRKAEWQGAPPEQPLGKVLLQITTMNKPDYCVDNLRLLAGSPSALEHVQEIVIVDQGNKKVQDEPDFEEVAALLQGKLRIINQANLGGSGGFSRGMYEAVQTGADYVLLLDDDVLLEPASIPRLLVFAEYCTTPTIVGGHMFDLHSRTVLYTFGETINPWSFQWGQPHEDQANQHDFRWSGLRETPWMHRRVDVDYNGWWMCLIPTKVIKEIGLSLPVFIKWDDAEYGVRAKRAGFPTVSLPGAALWHVTWADKDDSVGWQAYFHVRNRMIAALLHSPYQGGGSVLRDSGKVDVKHAVSMQYYAEAARAVALEDVLAGPEALHELQPTRIADMRALMNEYSDAQFRPSIDDFPPPRMVKPPKKGKAPTPPKVYMLPLWSASTIVKQLFVQPKPESRENPEVHVAHIDNKWWRLSRYDSAIVTNAEGSAIAWYQRDPEKLRKLLPRTLSRHAEIRRHWASLAKRYRDALPAITSLGAWEETFNKYTESEIRR